MWGKFGCGYTTSVTAMPCHLLLEEKAFRNVKGERYTESLGTFHMECARFFFINRATFYKHYLDVQDLLEKIEENLFEQIRAVFSVEDVEVYAFLLKMLRYTCREKDRYLVLGGDHGDPNLMTKTFLVCYESAYPLLSRNIPDLTENERQMLYHYLSHGAGGILTWWIKDGMKVPPEDVAQFVLDVCSITADGVQNPNRRKIYRD